MRAWSLPPRRITFHHRPIVSVSPPSQGIGMDTTLRCGKELVGAEELGQDLAGEGEDFLQVLGLQ